MNKDKKATDMMMDKATMNKWHANRQKHNANHKTPMTSQHMMDNMMKRSPKKS